MVSGEVWGLPFHDICLRVEEKTRKTSTRKTDPTGIESGPARWLAFMVTQNKMEKKKTLYVYLNAPLHTTRSAQRIRQASLLRSLDEKIFSTHFASALQKFQNGFGNILRYFIYILLNMV